MTGTTLDKSMVEISQNFVAFSEYMNFRYLVKPFGQFWLAFVSWLHDQTSFFFRISGEKKLLTKWLLIIVKIPRWTLYNMAISFELGVNELFWGKLTSALSCAALLRNFRHCIYPFVLQIDIFVTNHGN